MGRRTAGRFAMGSNVPADADPVKKVELLTRDEAVEEALGRIHSDVELIKNWHPPCRGTAQEKFEWAIDQMGRLAVNSTGLQNVIFEMMEEDPDFKELMLKAPQKEIAIAVGKSQQWVSVNYGGLRKQFKERQKSKALEMLSEGATQKQVGGLLGVPQQTISRWEKSTKNTRNSKMGGAEDHEPCGLAPSDVKEDKHWTVERKIEFAIEEIIKSRKLPLRSFEKQVGRIVNELVKTLV